MRPVRIARAILRARVTRRRQRQQNDDNEQPGGCRLPVCMCASATHSHVCININSNIFEVRCGVGDCRMNTDQQNPFSHIAFCANMQNMLRDVRFRQQYCKSARVCVCGLRFMRVGGCVFTCSPATTPFGSLISPLMRSLPFHESARSRQHHFPCHLRWKNIHHICS